MTCKYVSLQFKLKKYSLCMLYSLHGAWIDWLCFVFVFFFFLILRVNACIIMSVCAPRAYPWRPEEGI